MTNEFSFHRYLSIPPTKNVCAIPQRSILKPSTLHNEPIYCTTRINVRLWSRRWKEALLLWKRDTSNFIHISMLNTGHHRNIHSKIDICNDGKIVLSCGARTHGPNQTIRGIYYRINTYKRYLQRVFKFVRFLSFFYYYFGLPPKRPKVLMLKPTIRHRMWQPATKLNNLFEPADV